MGAQQARSRMQAEQRSFDIEGKPGRVHLPVDSIGDGERQMIARQELRGKEVWRRFLVRNLREIRRTVIC